MSWNKYVTEEVTDEEAESQIKSIFIGIYLGVTAVALLLLVVSAIVDGTHAWQLPWWTAHFWYSIGWLALSLAIRKIKWVLYLIGVLILALFVGPHNAAMMLVGLWIWSGIEGRFERLEGKEPERIEWPPIYYAPIHKQVVRVFFGITVALLSLWLVYSYITRPWEPPLKDYATLPADAIPAAN